MRSSPQVAFCAAISRIRRRRSFGRRGRPMGLDFQRQNSRNPWRCQRMSVGALTFTSASRHGNMRLRVAIIQRVELLARRGLTWRSWKSASCLRRKRVLRPTLAANGPQGWPDGSDQSQLARSFGSNVQGFGRAMSLALTLSMARYRTLRDLPLRLGRSFCGLQADGARRICPCYRERDGREKWPAESRAI